MSDPRRDKVEFARRIAEDVRLADENMPGRGLGIGSLATAIELLAEALLAGPGLSEALLSDADEGRLSC